MLKIVHAATLAVLLAGAVAPSLGCTADDRVPETAPALLVGEDGPPDANGCRESGIIFAHGVANPAPRNPALNAAGMAALTANQAGEPARLQAFWSWQWVNNGGPWAAAALPTFGTVYDNVAVNATMWTGAGQLTTGDVSVVYNRNTGADGAAGRTNAIAAGEMAQLILWYYNHGYKRLGIASHSNGVYTIHAGWTQARALIAAARFTTRPAACLEMEVRFAHVQAAVWRGNPGLIHPRDDTHWTIPNPAAAGTFFARLYAVDFMHNRDQRNEGTLAGDNGNVRAMCSREAAGGTVVNEADTWSVGSTVGRTGSWPWVLDNRLAACAPFGGTNTWSSGRARFWGSFSCSPHQELFLGRMGVFPWTTATNRNLGRADRSPPVGATHCDTAGGILRSRTSICNERYDCW